MNDSIMVSSRQLTKRGIELKVKQLVEEVEEGSTDPIKMYIQLAALKRVVDGTMKGIRREAIELVDRVESWDREWAGVWLQIRSGPVKLDYSKDEEWLHHNAMVEELDAKLKIAKKARKKREAYLKNQYFDNSTGEILGDVDLLEIGAPQLVVRFQDGE